MKTLGIVIFLFSIFSFGKVGVPQKAPLYQVTAIDSINNWYTIYATKGDRVYKIVTKKDSQYVACKEKITIGQSYDLILVSHWDGFPEKFKPMNYLDISCFSYDENTLICIDIKNRIYDLYHTQNIKGLCYVSKPL